MIGAWKEWEWNGLSILNMKKKFFYYPFATAVLSANTDWWELRNLLTFYLVWSPRLLSDFLYVFTFGVKVSKRLIKKRGVYFCNFSTIEWKHYRKVEKEKKNMNTFFRFSNTCVTSQDMYVLHSGQKGGKESFAKPISSTKGNTYLCKRWKASTFKK